MAVILKFPTKTTMFFNPSWDALLCACRTTGWDSVLTHLDWWRGAVAVLSAGEALRFADAIDKILDDIPNHDAMAELLTHCGVELENGDSAIVPKDAVPWGATVIGDALPPGVSASPFDRLSRTKVYLPSLIQLCRKSGFEAYS